MAHTEGLFCWIQTLRLAIHAVSFKDLYLKTMRGNSQQISFVRVQVRLRVSVSGSGFGKSAAQRHISC